MGQGRGERTLPHDPVLAGLTLDSRRVQPGYLFAALAGSFKGPMRFVAMP
jgi:UDP-N-acetylmuramoyl-L-alanyl-D-glutamate--2,6-diaminopimelate ligase